MENYSNFYKARQSTEMLINEEQKMVEQQIIQLHKKYPEINYNDLTFACRGKNFKSKYCHNITGDIYEWHIGVKKWNKIFTC